jgi:glycosyl transferase family 25
MTLVHIISIREPDDPVLVALRDSVIAHGMSPVIVEGLRGAQLPAGEYFALAKRYYLETRRFMTPGEVGCTMSHVNAWRRIATGTAVRGVVIEDDALLDDEFGARVRALLADPRLADTFVSLGGQEGKLGLPRQLRGRALDGLPETWEVCPADLERLTGTVGYLVPKSIAASLAKDAEDGASIVDDFPRTFARGLATRFAISNVVGHPWVDVQSAIQRERAEFMKGGEQYHRPLLQRLIQELRATFGARARVRHEARQYADYQLIPWRSRFQRESERV